MFIVDKSYSLSDKKSNFNVSFLISFFPLNHLFHLSFHHFSPCPFHFIHLFVCCLFGCCVFWIVGRGIVLADRMLLRMGFHFQLFHGDYCRNLKVKLQLSLLTLSKAFNEFFLHQFLLDILPQQLFLKANFVYQLLFFQRIQLFLLKGFSV